MERHGRRRHEPTEPSAPDRRTDPPSADAIALLRLVRRGAVERGADDAAVEAVDRAIGWVPRGGGASGFAARRRDALLGMVADGEVQRALVLCREHVAHHPDDIVIAVLHDVLLASRTDHGDTSGTTNDDGEPSDGTVT